MKWVLTIVVILSGLNGSAKESSSDSLTAELEQNLHDTTRAKVYLKLWRSLQVDHPDTANYFLPRSLDITETGLVSNPERDIYRSMMLTQIQALHEFGLYFYGIAKYEEALVHQKKSLQTAEEIVDKKGMLNALSSIGVIYHRLGKISEALLYNERGLGLARDIGYQNDLAAMLLNLGSIYSDQGNIQKALGYYSESLKIYESLPDSIGMAYSLEYLGTIYMSQGEVEVAMEGYERCLAIYTDLEDRLGMAYAMVSIGKIHRIKKDVDQALEYHKKSLLLMQEMNYKRGIYLALTFIAHDYQDQGKLAEALSNYSQSLILAEETHDVVDISRACKSIGDILLKQGALEEAAIVSTRSLDLAQEMGIPNEISESSKLLSNIFRRQGKFRKALDLFELHIIMRDSIANDENKKAVIRQQTKYEFEKAQLVKEQEEKETARLEAEATSRRDNLQYSAISIFLVILVISMVMVSSRKQSLRALSGVEGEGSTPKGGGVKRLLEGLIFFTFLILFEFILVLADPYIETWSSGAPGIKLLFNAGIAALIFPLHAFFETKLKGRLVKR